MKKGICIFATVLPLLLALLVAPLTLAQTSEDHDRQGIYLVVSWSATTAEQHLEALGIKRIGPVRAPFAFFVDASNDLKQIAENAGYRMIPASALAAICGATPQEIST